MGALISFLKSKEGADVFVDFENAQPTATELELHTRVNDILARSQDVCRRLEEYKGCQDLARKAMSTPTFENEQTAFEGLLSSVDDISVFYHFARELEEIIPELLNHLSRPSETEAKQALQDQQALAKQIADIFNFSLRFDSTRMLRPFISNDFSYYRRLLPKFSKHPRVRIKDDEASGMALFTAEHIPMMSALAKGTTAALEKNEYVTAALAAMANVCLAMIKSKKYTRPETNLFCARAMTGGIIIFDHVDAIGAFHKKSPVQIRPCVMLLKREFPKEGGLLSAIHFSTKHFKDAPPSLQELFD